MATFRPKSKTITRSKLGWDILRNFEVPAPRCNHIELYLNNQYVGVYANVEQIDEEFVESRFGNKDGNTVGSINSSL